MEMIALEMIIIVIAIYAAAYYLYGKNILEKKVVRADGSRLTPAIEKFDGVDYAPANKWVLFGHHFASIAGAGPIIGPATALMWGWGLPLIWVLFGNIFIGAVHDYLSLMASVRHGGLSVMSISEKTMGRKAKYVFLAYVWFALVLILAAFLSVASSTYVGTPEAATMTWIFMPLALFFGVLVYRAGLNVWKATVILLILEVLGFIYALYHPLVVSYSDWVIILTIYSFLAAALPVWYLLQPRDYLNAYMLWVFVGLAVLGGLMVAGTPLNTKYMYIDWAAPGSVVGAIGSAANQKFAWFWPFVPLTIACGALSGFHSVVASGTSSKQLANELEGLLVGYGGMLTEGAVSSLAVLLPAAITFDFTTFMQTTGISATTLQQIGINVSSTPTLLNLGAQPRFVTAYGLTQALAWSKLGVDFTATYKVFKVFAATALTAFVVTTLDTANRLARFAWVEFFDWVKPRNALLYRVLANRWVASLVSILLGFTLAYPQVPDPSNPGKYIYAYQIIWPAFSGTNQLLAAIALLTVALWAWHEQKVRGGIAWLIIIPAGFLWLTVTLALALWLYFTVPSLPALYLYSLGIIVAISLLLDIALIVLFVKGLRKK
jgi:carbon starvation protein